MFFSFCIIDISGLTTVYIVYINIDMNKGMVNETSRCD